MDLYSQATDYLDAGLRLIPLNPIVGGKCGCEDPECPAAGKHPKRASWQHQALVDTATLHDIWRVHYQCTGFGWALDGEHIVIDVDKRNGGLPSLEALQKDIGVDLFETCTAIVKTGGAGWHFYFRKADAGNLGWKLPKQYKGIDVKQAGGFVVTAGSQHASGSEYAWHSAAKSDLMNLALLPEALKDMLSRAYTEHKEALKESGQGDLDELKDMLTVLNPDMQYEDWLKVGMAIHDATDGSAEAYDLWDSWSRGGQKYKEGVTSYKWHSFGKYTGAAVGSGSLVKMARDAGWEPNIDSKMLTPEQLAEIKANWDKVREERGTLPSMADDTDIDLHKPPGLLGRINDYVYGCSVFPNKNLALACSLSVLTNVIGNRYHLPGKYAGFQPNLLVLCVAGSSVGKDPIIGAAHKLMTGLGLGAVINGRIKSDKDLVDALEANQFAMYLNDEFGQFLMRLENASQKGSATYLEGIIGTIMDSFTKGDKTFLIDKSRRKAIIDGWKAIINTLNVELEAGKFRPGETADDYKKKIKRAKFLLGHFQNGLPNPFISIFATATPRSMINAFSGEATENGFLSRSLTFFEHETNPRPRPDFQGQLQVSPGLHMALKKVCFVRDECPFGRVDAYGAKREELKVDPDAMMYLERMREYFYDYAEMQKENSLESLPRRAPDSVFKICIALAAESGTVTLQMARYAVKMVRHEIGAKIARVTSTEGMLSKDKGERATGVAARVLEVCTTDAGETGPVIYSKVKRAKLTKEDLSTLIDELVNEGKLEAVPSEKQYKGETVYRFRTTMKGKNQ